MGSVTLEPKPISPQPSPESGCPPPFKEEVMNIDYGQILKNVTARQEALELLELAA